MENISPRPVSECVSAEVADALTRSFERYFVPVVVGPEVFERRFRAEHLDRLASRLYYSGETLAAILLVARRGRTSRVAALAIVPDMRGRGLGRRIMTEALGEARARGDRAIVLEVIEENSAAIALYERLGFRIRRRLVGYQLSPGALAGEAAGGEAADPLVEEDQLEFARFAAREGDDDLPWMLAAETFAGVTTPARAYSLGGHVYALIGNTASEPITLSGLVVRRSERRGGWGRRMIRALGAAYPGRGWTVPATVPEDLAPEFFARTGWERQQLTQFEMRAELG